MVGAGSGAAVVVGAGSGAAVVVGADSGAAVVVGADSGSSSLATVVVGEAASVSSGSSTGSTASAGSSSTASTASTASAGSSSTASAGSSSTASTDCSSTGAPLATVVSGALVGTSVTVGACGGTDSVCADPQALANRATAMMAVTVLWMVAARIMATPPQLGGTRLEDERTARSCLLRSTAIGGVAHM